MKIKLTSQVSIYTNNLCNKTCDNCCGLANYNFAGVFKWETHADFYKKWAEILDFDVLSFVGGEPFLNPELDVWYSNLRELWPNTKFEVYTNGTRLDKSAELVKKMIAHPNTWITVSCHSAKDWEPYKNKILNLLLSTYDNIEITEEPVNEYTLWNSLIFSYKGKKLIGLKNNDLMVKRYYKEVTNGTIFFEDDGDQELSHTNCVFKDAYTFQHGLLYKCPPVVNYAEAKTQITYQPSVAEIFEQYKPINPFDDFETVKESVRILDKSIPVCKLCAYDKEKPLTLYPVTFDLNYKKQFRKPNSI